MTWNRTLALYDGFADNSPKVPAFEGEDLVELLTSFGDPECSSDSCIGSSCSAKMNARSWSPAVYPEGATRGDDNVLALNFAIFDLDHLKANEIDQVRARIAEYENVMHSTHSHAPGDECYRLVMPVSRPMTPEEWQTVYAIVVEAFELPVDPACTPTPSRLYACPTSRVGVAAFAARNKGCVIDVDEAIEANRVGQPETAIPSAPVIPAAPPVMSLDELRERLAAARRSKARGTDEQKQQAAILACVLEGRPLADRGARDATLLRACGLLAYWLPAHTPWEVALEILRPTLIVTDAEPEGLPHWIEEARKKYVRQSASRDHSDAARAEKDARQRTAFDTFRGQMQAKATSATTGDAIDDGWADLLIEGKDGPNVCEHNAATILTHAPELRGTIRWNDVERQIEINGGPLDGVASATLDVAAAGYLQSRHAFFANAGLVGRALLQVARANAYDPIADFLDGLAWDGIARIDDFLIGRCGAVTRNDAGRDITEHLRRISRRWFIGLIARALRPGCQMDNTLILEGAQGIRKSSLLRALGGRWFCETELNLEDKDAKLLVSSAWIMELSEITSLSKGPHKGFISSPSDKFRPPYGRVNAEPSPHMTPKSSRKTG